MSGLLWRYSSLSDDPHQAVPDLEQLARQLGISREDADALYAQAEEEASDDPERAWATCVAMLERLGHGKRRTTPGKHALTSRLGGDPTRPRRRGTPGKHALTSGLNALQQATPRAGAVAFRSPESAGPLDELPGGEAAPLDQALRYSRGTPLPTELRCMMERLFGQSFADVRIHVDNSASAAAASINARAFTIADRVFFREAAYAPDTRAGLELLAHELTHVVQWRAGRVPAGPQRISNPGDTLEHEAAAAGHDVARRARAAEPGTASVASARTAGSRPTGPAHSIGSGGLILRDDARDPHASVDTIPAGGQPINKVGIVAWDRSPALRLRSSASTTEDNLITSLPFNTHLQVIKEFPGKWLFVSTEHGQLGYVAKDYVKTNLPEPNAQLHKVENGLPGFAIAIAERYYKPYADDWGQDLRFYVNVLAWVNHRAVPNTTSGWRDVKFDAGDYIWVPTHAFARSLKGVVNSASITHNIADSIGIADFLDRVGELWDDVRTAIALSMKYMPEAIGRHVEAALWGVLESLAMMLVLAAAVLAISTAIGAGLGALAGGVGAAPGAAAGFEVGMVLLNWLGLAMLVVWIGQSLVRVGSAFGSFLGKVWNARGDQAQLDLAARQFAEAIGTLCGVLIEGLVMWAVSIGATKALSALRGTRFGTKFNNSKTGEWLNERVRRVKSGEAAVPTPKDVLSGLIRGIELVDARNSPLGEFDGIDMPGRRFIENKAATGIEKPNPRTGKPQQTALQWAQKQITKKTQVRIKALADAVATRGPGGKPAPALSEIQGFRKILFMVDGDSPALRAAVFAELAALRSANPGWTFSAEFGIKISIPPVPGTGQPDDQ